jgi:Cu/Ag efflux protein CusF
VLKHEAIKSIGMDAMTMLFDASPKLDLKNYKPGDPVRFQVTINDGVLEVIALEKTP